MKRSAWRNDMIQRLGSTVLAISLSISVAQATRAGDPPYVEFDVPYTVCCNSVAPINKASQSASKIVEVRVDISVLVKSGDAKDLEQVVYELRTKGQGNGSAITDIAPKTSTYTDIADPLVIIDEDSTTVSGGGELRGEYKVVGALNVNAAKTHKSTVSYSKLPPRDLVLASGFIERHQGAFFKLKPTTQDTLEGAKSFSFLMTVPTGWRAGWIDIRCHATGYRRGLHGLLDSKIESGLARFSVGLYINGDDDAQALAQQLASAQQAYFDELWRTRERNRKIFSVLKWLFRFASPIGASSGMNDTIMEKIESNPDYAEKLSPDLQQKLKGLQDARDALSRMSK
jgi:hypothetical protein